MRDDYYDNEITYEDAWDEWLDDEESYEEPVKEPAPRRQAAGSQVRRRGQTADDAPERKRSVGLRQGERSRDRMDADREERGWRDRYEDRKGRTGSDRTPASSGAGSGAGNGSPLNDLLLLAFKVGLVAMFLVLMTTFFYGVTQVRDTSMEPSCKEGDLVIYYRPDKDYASRDAIVVDYNGTLQVRRVVAVAGDVVDISADGGLIINGSTQIEDDIYTTTYPYTEGITFPVTVGAGEVFVLGDNRTSAEDSRMYGTVKITATKGAVMTVIRRRGI